MSMENKTRYTNLTLALTIELRGYAAKNYTELKLALADLSAIIPAGTLAAAEVTARRKLVTVADDFFAQLAQAERRQRADAPDKEAND